MKLYVLVREDLSRSQQAVQAGHAVAEWLLEHSDENLWHNGTLVYLRGGKSHEEIWNNYSKFTMNSVTTFFDEPDMDNETTAVAILGTNDVLEQLKDFRLL